MFQMIKDWYNAYKPATTFFGHKITHVFGCMLVGVVATQVNVLLALIICPILAIGKEVSDHYRSFDSSADKSKGEDPYRYAPPLSFHVLDVIITVLGGLVGIGLATYILTTKMAVMLSIAVLLGINMIGTYLNSLDK